MDILKTKYNKNPLVGDVYCLNSLKIILDDVIKEFMDTVKNSKQSTVSSDIKISTGLVSAAITGATVYISLTSEFKQHKSIMTVLVVAYFVINILVEIYERWNGKSMVFGSKTVSTTINASDAIYTVVVHDSTQPTPNKYTRSVFELFDSDGKLIHERFIEDIQDLFEK
ncbi:microsomal signal peptidase [Ordospora colligata]|uniref:Signal peptidase complex subunit 2 n=1 Tax=Ordospora colligata OC4 TaxID=1354746 RepID=A0A0B2UML5_9MICR|nr:microsomal signal peptidase [Ordospora colligata OC4]KHN70272.1 microsomal signal peptidase [Ordospora colligata OC4]TBU16816.1 microsomal signal peptidase [Ordospora colligata]TBU16924.1 microsomal signal peptidase [Ordospora colligata]TBU19365.1 microsomal signal peptidase [Ordospora colligata]